MACYLANALDDADKDEERQVGGGHGREQGQNGGGQHAKGVDLEEEVGEVSRLNGSAVGRTFLAP